MRVRACVVFATIAVLGVGWAGCTHTDYVPPASADGSANDGTLDEFLIVEDTFECSPCFQVCACTPGDTFYSPGKCMTVYCPPEGMWGGPGECGGLGCAEASPEPEAGPEAGPTDAGRDGPDATSAGDSGGDSGMDATDAPGQ
jgi:hypothetical protein